MPKSLLIILLLIPQILHAQELLDTTDTWEGKPISYPPGRARVVSQKITMAHGEATEFHCHPVPTLGYVLEGAIKVETKDKRARVFRQGEALVEALNTTHRGIAIDGPVTLIVFFVGSTRYPNTKPGRDACA